MRTAALAEGFLAEPEGGPQPGVVVIPDVWGLADHTRDIAQRLAREGFAALALDVYRKTGRPSLAEPAAAMAWIRGLSDPLVLETVQEGIDALAARAGGKVGLIGFCMGGQYAWLAACACRRPLRRRAVLRDGALRAHARSDEEAARAARRGGDAVVSRARASTAARTALIPNADVDELEPASRASGSRTRSCATPARGTPS